MADAVSVSWCDGDSECERVADGENDAVSDVLLEADTDGLREGDGVSDGLREGVGVNDGLSEVVGDTDSVKSTVRVAVVDVV